MKSQVSLNNETQAVLSNIALYFYAYLWCKSSFSIISVSCVMFFKPMVRQ